MLVSDWLGLISSPALLAELADVLGRSKFDAMRTRSKALREGALVDRIDSADNDLLVQQLFSITILSSAQLSSGFGYGGRPQSENLTVRPRVLSLLVGRLVHPTQIFLCS